jgi:hypothetical protein
MIFIKLGGTTTEGAVRQKEQGNCGGTVKSSRECDEAYKEFGDGPEGPRREGGGFIDPHIFR